MRFERTEIKTGIFFVLTFGILLLVVLYLAAPDVFKQRREFEIFFDNAGGLKPGAAVNLAGRKIGQVISIESPVAKKLRPRPDMEVLAILRVDASARVFRDASARMVAYGLLAELQIDFVRGNEESGLAESGTTFIGEREGSINDSASKAIKTLEPVAAAAEATIKDLRVTVGTLNAFFGQGSDLQASITNIKRVGENLGHLTEKDGALGLAIENIRVLSGKLASDTGSLMQTLAGLKEATDQLTKKKQLEQTLASLRAAAAKAERLIGGLEPKLAGTLRNVEQLTDTLKRQPWRVIWPSTKKYPEDNLPQPAPKVRPPARKKR